MVIGCPDPESGLDIRESGGEADEIGFLWQVLDSRTGLDEAFSSVGVYQPGRDPQQGRFAGAVTANKTDAVAGGNGQSRAGEQRRRPERQVDCPPAEAAAACTASRVTICAKPSPAKVTCLAATRVAGSNGPA